jgi:FkbM family methyltransferase
MAATMIARIAQSLTSGALLGRRGSSRLRRLLIRRAGDPPVELEIDGTRLRLPLSHDLPRTRRHYPYYAENLGEVALLVSSVGGKTMVDVGANVGDSVAIVKAHAPEMAILCVDADSVYVPYLRRNTAHWPDVEIAAPVLLAQQTGDLPGRLERGAGTSRFANSGPLMTTAISLGDLLAQRSRFSAPALLKSDTDGFEEHVLRGAAGLLMRTGPVLFLEYDPKLLRDAGSDGLEMLSWLRSIGYERVVYYDKYGKLMLHCTLADQALLEDLDTYAAGNGDDGVDYYDLVVATPAFSSVIDGLAAQG